MNGNRTVFQYECALVFASDDKVRSRWTQKTPRQNALNGSDRLFARAISRCSGRRERAPWTAWTSFSSPEGCGWKGETKWAHSDDRGLTRGLRWRARFPSQSADCIWHLCHALERPADMPGQIGNWYSARRPLLDGQTDLRRSTLVHQRRARALVRAAARAAA